MCVCVCPKKNDFVRKEKKSNENKNFETKIFFSNRQALSSLASKKGESYNVGIKRKTTGRSKAENLEFMFIVREIEESMRFVSLNSIEF